MDDRIRKGDKAIQKDLDSLIKRVEEKLVLWEGRIKYLELDVEGMRANYNRPKKENGLEARLADLENELLFIKSNIQVLQSQERERVYEEFKRRQLNPKTSR